MKNNFRRWGLTPLLVIMLVVMSITVIALDQHAQLIGSWKGGVVIQGQELPIQVNFKDGKEELRATIDIPMQGIKNMALSNVTFHESQIQFELPGGAVATFTGTLDGDQIEGEFTQAGIEGTFYLDRLVVDEEAETNGVYTKEEYNLETETGTLYGTLMMPKDQKTAPVVFIIAGSGPTDRDGNNPLGGVNNNLKMLAEALAEAGYATVRYDKRGIAESATAAPPQDQMKFDYFIEDAVAYLQKMQADSRFEEIAVLGHSQGSLIGMVAAEKVGVSAYISVSGSGRPIGQTLRDQLTTLPAGLKEEAYQIIEELEAGNLVAEINQQLVSIFHPTLQPFLISWMKYDPAEELKKLDIPVLVTQGSNDLQAMPADFEALQVGLPNVQIELIPGMNHVLKDVPDGDVQANAASYKDPEKPLDPEFVEVLVDFLTGVLG